MAEAKLTAEAREAKRLEIGEKSRALAMKLGEELNALQGGLGDGEGGCFLDVDEAQIRINALIDLLAITVSASIAGGQETYVGAIIGVNQTLQGKIQKFLQEWPEAPQMGHA